MCVLLLCAVMAARGVSIRIPAKHVFRAMCSQIKIILVCLALMLLYAVYAPFKTPTIASSAILVTTLTPFLPIMKVLESANLAPIIATLALLLIRILSVLLSNQGVASFLCNNKISQSLCQLYVMKAVKHARLVSPVFAIPATLVMS